MKFDAAASGKMKRSLSDLLYHDQARILYEEPGMLCLLLMHQCLFLKELHFRSPFMESCGAEIEIYDQYGISSYAISFDMKQFSKMGDVPQWR